SPPRGHADQAGSCEVAANSHRMSSEMTPPSVTLASPDRMAEKHTQRYSPAATSVVSIWEGSAPMVAPVPKSVSGPHAGAVSPVPASATATVTRSDRAEESEL